MANKYEVKRLCVFDEYRTYKQKVLKSGVLFVHFIKESSGSVQKHLTEYTITRTGTILNM